MIFLILFLMFSFAALSMGLMAAVSDYRGMTIPNLYSLLIFGAFILCYAALSAGGYADDVFAPPLAHGFAFLSVFVTTLVLFFIGVWGGGDQKLISAFSVWFGFHGLAVFLVYTALFGGLLAVVALVLRKWKPVEAPAKGSWVDQVQSGEGKVPYGIAISLGALASFFKIGYFSADTLRIFF